MLAPLSLFIHPRREQSRITRGRAIRFLSSSCVSAGSSEKDRECQERFHFYTPSIFATTVFTYSFSCLLYLLLTCLLRGNRLGIVVASRTRGREPLFYGQVNTTIVCAFFLSLSFSPFRRIFRREGGTCMPFLRGTF